MKKFGNPLPQPLPKECLKAARIFQSFVDTSNNGLDGVIPRDVLEQAKGFAIFTIVKAGFVFSARAGSGVVIAKLDNGSWSAPSAIGIAGVGVGSQIGAEMTDFLVVLNSRSAITSFMSAGSLTLGGNMSLALGPMGRTGEAAGAVSTKGKVAAMYSYSKTRGLFGGLSIEGSVIVERQDANAQAYDSPVTVRMLLGGHVDPPSWAQPLIKTLEACTGLPGTRQWIDDADRTPGGSYVFGATGSASSGTPSFSARTPSFFRKKKPAPPFPPPSWAREEAATIDSYFSDNAPRSHSRNMTWDGGPFADSGSASASSLPTHTPQSKSVDVNLARARSTSAAWTPSSNTRSRPDSDGNLLTFDEPTSLVISPTSDSASVSSESRKPFIKPREDLRRPLLPHEGVARAIALFDFNAVESGDLSFRKGDVVIITQKSESTDDWWTGKIDGRKGIFPANFVEVV